MNSEEVAGIVRATLLTLACAVGVTVAGADAAEDRADGARGAELAADWIRFRASFDAEVEATFALGDAAPVRVQGNIRFEPGRRGEAIRMGTRAGGAELRYALRDNVDLTKPGAVAFWVAPLAWDESGAGDQYVRLVRIHAGRGSMLLVQRERRAAQRREERFLAGLFATGASGVEGDRYLALSAGPRWAKRSWHLVVLTWDRTGFGASLDGEPIAWQPLPGALLERLVGDQGGAQLVLGGNTGEAWLLDDLTVYGRSLTDADVRRLRGDPAPATSG